jgi:K+-transporting ATPase ATPase A chain
MFGEIIFGGVGAGLYGMLIFIILTVFIAGLMVGRTPEYVGKKIEAREVQLVMISMIVMVFTILVMAAIGVLAKDGLAAIANNGPHGFSEILYAYTSQVGNNGSAFGGLSGNTPFWNITGAFAMFFGRFLMMIPMLAVAGSMARKRIHPGGEGTFPVHGGLFVGLLLGVIVLVGALTFFPALTLGPILEHFEMLSGKIY